jgi:hypothetical protein
LKGLSARVAALRATEVAADARTAANWRSGRVTQRTVTVLSDYVRRLRFVGDSLAVGTYGGEVHLIHVPTGRVVRTLVGLSAEVTSLDFDGVSVAAGAVDGCVCRWDAASGDGGEVGRHAGEAVTAVALEGAGVVAATAGGLLAAHGCLGGRTLQAAAPVCCLQRAGRYTAAGLADGRVVVWAGTAGEADAPDAPLLSRQILAFNAHTAPVLCLQLLTADAGAPDATEAATRLATGGADGVACVWDLAAGGAPLRRLTAHRAPVTCLQADAGKLVSGGRDGAIRVWDLVSGQQRFAIGGHTAYLDALQFEGGRLIVSGTNNLCVHRCGCCGLSAGANWISPLCPCAGSCCTTSRGRTRRREDTRSVDSKHSRSPVLQPQLLFAPLHFLERVNLVQPLRQARHQRRARSLQRRGRRAGRSVRPAAHHRGDVAAELIQHVHQVRSTPWLILRSP